MARVTIVAHEQVRTRMAAPAIRYVEMARALAARGHMVTLAVHNDPEVDLGPVRQLHDESQETTAAMQRSDIVIIGGGPYPETAANCPPPDVARVADMTFPLLLEGLAMHRVDPAGWSQPRLDAFTTMMSNRLLAADVILCGSAQQRHFYLGWLAALGRLNAQLIDRDAAADQLVRIVPFGCPSTAPRNTGHGPRRTIRGIGADDYLLIWSGHVTDWYDPGTVVEAVMAAAHDIERIRLVFIGADVRDERLGRTPTGARLRTDAERLDPRGDHIFFWNDWVPYEQRADWLLESDAAVIASPRTLEADLAVRARFLDYVWCALPLITTAGGTFADAVQQAGLGVVVEPGDVRSMTQAITHLASGGVRQRMRERLDSLRPEHEWDQALRPLFDFCESPALAPDRGEWMPDPTHEPPKRRVSPAQVIVRRVASRLRDAAGRVA
ncbi:MAG: glycosyltransferase [Candidatus Dormibacteraeota bacterium]|nr:glycosyltransferase [Candidatus Dormibacteraeota bacterium]